MQLNEATLQIIARDFPSALVAINPRRPGLAHLVSNALELSTWCGIQRDRLQQAIPDSGLTLCASCTSALVRHIKQKEAQSQ